MASSVTDPPPKSSSKLSFIKLYLVCYNSFLAVAWSLILLKASVHMTEKKTFTGLYNEIEFWLKVAQTAALFEVLHAIIGIVRSSAFNVFVQVGSRIFVLWVICANIIMKFDGDAKNTIGFPMLLLAWSITEVVRYSYYTNVLLECSPYPLTWCRYSLFLVLYPVGITGEILCILASLPILEEKKMYSITLPNVFNFSINIVYVFYTIIFCCYPPAFYILYTYMMRQRKKVLATDKLKEN